MWIDTLVSEGLMEDQHVLKRIYTTDDVNINERLILVYGFLKDKDHPMICDFTFSFEIVCNIA